MDTQIVTLESAHTLSIPDEAAAALGLHKGSKLALSLKDGAILLQPLLADNLDELCGIFASKPDLEEDHSVEGALMSDEEIERSLDELQARFARRPGEPSLEDELYKSRREDEEHARRKYGC